MEIDGMEKQWKNRGSDVGPLSRKARVKQWKNNGKLRFRCVTTME